MTRVSPALLDQEGMMKPIQITAALAFTASAGTTVANAAPVSAQGGTTQIVSYAGLDLNSPADQRKLQSRVAWAATSLCLEDDRGSPAPPSVNRTCFRETMKDALHQMERAIARANGSATFAFTPADMPRR
jgi:UrcA family protein